MIAVFFFSGGAGWDTHTHRVESPQSLVRCAEGIWGVCCELGAPPPHCSSSSSACPRQPDIIIELTVCWAKVPPLNSPPKYVGNPDFTD